MPAPRDTNRDAWSRHIEFLQGIGPQARVRLALTMSDDVHEIARAGIQTRHPEWSATQIQEGLEELVLGAKAARTARQERVAPKR